MSIVAITAEIDHTTSITELRALASEYGVTISPVTENGPGAGWNVAHVTGSYDAVVAMLDRLGYDPAAHLDLRPR